MADTELLPAYQSGQSSICLDELQLLGQLTLSEFGNDSHFLRTFLIA